MTEEERTALYTLYAPKVLGYIRSRVSDGYLAEDLCANVFLKVYEKLETFDEEKASLSTWIFTIARNTLTDYYRTRSVHEELPDVLADPVSVEDTLLTEETLRHLASALEKLDVKSRDLLILYYYSGVKLKDVADRMGISYPYAKVLHRRALEKVRVYFEEGGYR